MHFPRRYLHLWSLIAMFGVGIAGSPMASAQGLPTEARSATGACPENDSGLKLPPGFCATVFADGIGHARHLVVASNGVVYVNTWSGRYYGNDKPHAGGFLVALQDTTGAGKANVNERFGETVQSGGAGGTGIGLYKNSLFAEINDKIVRYPLSAGSIVPQGPAVAIVTGLPLGGDHPMHPFAIDTDGSLYIDVATATNACQAKNRTAQSPGIDPCTELETRGGIWRYDANKTNQAFSPAERFATGIRNAEGFAITAADLIFVTMHGRDQLHANWPQFYKPEEEATQPAEELLSLRRGGDYGWPECYYDAIQGKLVLAPEYGGDGGKKVGPCATKSAPIAGFPAHWAPNAMALYNKQQFPAHYRNGVFIAFHGSWDRAPYPQGGYNVVFQALAGDRATGGCEIFADGFAGGVKSPGEAQHRPSGLAVGPTARCSSPMMCADAFTASFIEARQAPKQKTRNTRPVQTRRPPPAMSVRMTRNLRKALIPTPAPQPRPRACRFRPARPKRWLRSATVFTTVKSAERPARVATARTRRARPWVRTSPPATGFGAMAAIRQSRR